jgi:hypothetical protein
VCSDAGSSPATRTLARLSAVAGKIAITLIDT